jgi:hypothetical protein
MKALRFERRLAESTCRYDWYYLNQKSERARQKQMYNLRKAKLCERQVNDEIQVL